MGNYHTRSIKFRQSLADFPLLVSLGNTVPSWGLSRWKGNSDLRFVPADDEGFSLRGDRRRLLYKGRKKSHRITILGDTAFEYDCILEREPESNVVALRMEGAEQFDFFRQPDFVKDPFLKGSYAVYKKETLIGEGTGKLCHIHRPLIIDALGRKVWGDLAVVGNELRITIPEQWLAMAKYPVVVDPTVGTTTVGAFWENFKEWDDYYEDGEWVREYHRFYIEGEVAVNKFILPEKMQGEATAYLYLRDDEFNTLTCPVLYEDSGNRPTSRLSSNEGYVPTNTPQSLGGWLSTTFRPKNNSIASGTNVWFGLISWYFGPHYDYGAKSYKEEVPYSYYSTKKIPDTYPSIYFNNLDYKFSWYFTYGNAENFVRTLTQGVTLTDTQKLSMELKRSAVQTAKVTDSPNLKIDYKRASEQIAAVTDTSKTPIAFVRTHTHNVSLTDSGKWPVGFNRIISLIVAITDSWKNTEGYNRTLAEDVTANEIQKHTADYQRLTTQSVPPSDHNSLQADYQRNAIDTVQGITVIARVQDFFRQCLVTVANTVNLARLPIFERIINEIIVINDVAKHSRELNRKCDEAVAVHCETKREQGFFSEILDILFTTDANRYSVVFVRSIIETQGITDGIRHLGNYIRGLYVEAGNIAETVRWGDYYRKEHDVVQVEGAVLRHLIIFIRILTTSLVRDFLLRRFLIAREELELKSCISREIILESKMC